MKGTGGRGQKRGGALLQCGGAAERGRSRPCLAAAPDAGCATAVASHLHEAVPLLLQRHSHDAQRQQDGGTRAVRHGTKWRELRLAPLMATLLP